MATAVGEAAEKLWDLGKTFAPLAAGIVIMGEVKGAVMGIGAALMGLSLNPVGALVTALGLLASAFIAAKIAGMDFGEYLDTIFEKLTGIETAVGWLHRQEAGEKAINKNVGNAEDAIKRGDPERAQRAIDALKEKREAIAAEQRKAYQDDMRAKMQAQKDHDDGDWRHRFKLATRSTFTRTSRPTYIEQSKRRKSHMAAIDSSVRILEGPLLRLRGENFVRDTIVSRGIICFEGRGSASARSPAV